MDIRTYRGSSLVAGFGALFAGPAAIAIVITSWEWAEKGISVNDELRTDLGALVLVVAFLMIFVAIGTGIMAAAYISRIEASSEGVQFYDWLNRRTFDAQWAEVTRYELLTKNRWDRSKVWTMAAGSKSGHVPLVRDLAEFHRQVLRHAPSSIVPSFERPASGFRLSERTTFALGSTSDHLSVIFSILGFGLIAFFLYLLVADISANTPDGPREIVLAILLVSFVVALGALNLPDVVEAWRRVLFGRLDVDAAGIEIRIGKKEERFFWRDLRMVELGSIETEDSSITEVRFIGLESSLELRGGEAAISHALAAAAALAPEGTYFFNSRLSMS